MFLAAISKFLKDKNYPFFNVKAVFFDMDGVLFDSMPFHATAWVQAMQDVKIPFTHTEAYMNEGRTGHSTIDDAFNRTFGREATEAEKQEIYKLKSKYFDATSVTTKMPMAHELLQKIQAQALQIFVVTGSGQPSLIDGLQIYFPGVFNESKMVTAFDVKQGKPHPEPYLKALLKSGVEAWESVVVENAPLGVQSAKAAGLFVIALNTGPLDKQVLYNSGADVVLDSMDELYSVWDEFYNNMPVNIDRTMC